MSLRNNYKLDELIDNHENQNIEFKESFRWNHYKNQIDRSIINKTTSAICGFLTSKEGGKILIGVSDNKEIKEDHIITYKTERNGNSRITNIQQNRLNQGNGDFCKSTKGMIHRK
ncbi:MAG: helix-turn-helix domain-containing protein, partial [Candidatus Odinarchaeota archaeon]